jgi:hypothetical protein
MAHRNYCVAARHALTGSSNPLRRVYTPSPPKANHFLEADVTDQIYPPKRPNMAHFEIPERQTEQDNWKAQLGQLLEDYRNQYVLPRHSGEKPTP